MPNAENAKTQRCGGKYLEFLVPEEYDTQNTDGITFAPAGCAVLSCDRALNTWFAHFRPGLPFPELESGSQAGLWK